MSFKSKLIALGLCFFMTSSMLPKIENLMDAELHEYFKQELINSKNARGKLEMEKPAFMGLGAFLTVIGTVLLYYVDKNEHTYAQAAKVSFGTASMGMGLHILITVHNLTMPDTVAEAIEKTEYNLMTQEKQYQDLISILKVQKKHADTVAKNMKQETKDAKKNDT